MCNNLIDILPDDVITHTVSLFLFDFSVSYGLILSSVSKQFRRAINPFLEKSKLYINAIFKCINDEGYLQPYADSYNKSIFQSSISIYTIFSIYSDVFERSKHPFLEENLQRAGSSRIKPTLKEIIQHSNYHTLDGKPLVDLLIEDQEINPLLIKWGILCCEGSDDLKSEQSMDIKILNVNINISDPDDNIVLPPTLIGCRATLFIEGSSKKKLSRNNLHISISNCKKIRFL
jgi:hypothetical protein